MTSAHSGLEFDDDEDFGLGEEAPAGAGLSVDQRPLAAV